MVEGIEILTPRLLLRPFQGGDAEDVLEFANEEDEFGRTFSSDEEFARLQISGPVTRQIIDMLLAEITAAPWHDNPRFAIVSDGTVIGELDIHVHHVDLTGELGYGIARKHWGKGVATEAARAALDFGFSAFGSAKMFAWLDQRNVRSKRVLEKLGMRQEGLLRSHRIRQGTRVDSLIYGLSREEWEAMKRLRTGWLQH